MPSKLKSIRKRDAVTVAEGREVGRPADVLIDPERHEVSIVVLTRGALPDTSVIVHADRVRSFDSDTLAIEDLDSLKIAARDDEALTLMRRGLEFQGRPLLTSEGRRLGKIRQVVVDQEGRVIAYHVRRGLLGWLQPALRIEPVDLGTSGGEIAVTRGSERSDTRA